MKNLKFTPYQSSLAPYACHFSRSRGRLHKEKEDPSRTVFQRDRDRIIHCAAFRRLEYKTQVFVNHEGDHYRTRLTHSLEVSQLARSMSRILGLDEDLAEALALAHDLGHTPFGHAGEDALSEVMKEHGGFDHNAQTIRILTSLEHRYAGFDGLNLTWETLEGIAKHNGPLKKPIPRAIAEYNKKHDLELNSYPGAEAQLASLADDIAYNNHDIDDGLRAGLFTVQDLADLPLIGASFAQVKKDNPGIEQHRLIHEAIRKIINSMVVDLLEQTSANLRREKINSAGDIRALGKPLAMFSPAMKECNKALKNFLMTHMYRHYKVNRMTSKARRVVCELFTFFLHEPECLPTSWQQAAGKAGSTKTAQMAADFIAGMTDRFALEEHERIFDVRAKKW